MSVPVAPLIMGMVKMAKRSGLNTVWAAPLAVVLGMLLAVGWDARTVYPAAQRRIQAGLWGGAGVERGWALRRGEEGGGAVGQPREPADLWSRSTSAPIDAIRHALNRARTLGAILSASSCCSRIPRHQDILPVVLSRVELGV